MKQNAVLVNVGRGEVLDQNALMDASQGPGLMSTTGSRSTQTVNCSARSASGAE
ncbi:NAD(P)-dependent oxidoreductase [Paenarthrobacter nicotinovorans]|uniref:NAD(P)-dependent oxidoreductase n=1 Tax=Paenarthrobacter nicotinovorans TaxID=29320 RepID=UPI0018D2C3E0